ncbi:hypothetical protein ZIOFF_035378 [Zingiber officinale]|uniref:RRM domain-containing protein n=1 Tax=Zingiber officinale TaxID=94328 RepID=A0A8J5GGC3_ZINOF|nr:hypothetical protein ZIOFF_035378 [Zingiber officinale]
MRSQAPESAWQHDMYSAVGFPAPTARASSIETGTKLTTFICVAFAHDDICFFQELFSEVGDLKRYSINYDRSGRSKGTAEVVFARRLDALAAVKKYDNVLLDGKPMKIDIIGTNIPTPTVVPQLSNGAIGIANGAPRSIGPVRSFVGLPRAGGPGRGRGRGRGKGRGEPVSAAALDADLDKYHAEVMQTN